MGENKLYFFRESKVLKRVIECCLLNGGVFLASILVFEYGLLPGLKSLLSIVFGQNSGTGSTIWSWMQPALSLLFGMIWILPLFILSKVVNSLWFQVICLSIYYQIDRELDKTHFWTLNLFNETSLSRISQTQHTNSEKVGHS